VVLVDRQFEANQSGLVWAPIVAVDSFVVGTNKSVETDGNGEARLHLGTKGADADEFFGPESTPLEFRLSKPNLLQLLDYLRPVYRACYADYRGGKDLTVLWEERREKVEQLSDVIVLSALRRPYRDSDKRAYLSSPDAHWELLRELPLSRSAIFRISRPSAPYEFDLRVVPVSQVGKDALLAAEELSRYGAQAELEESGGLEAFQTVVERIAKTRRGQQAFKRDVLRRMPVCPFTGISELPLLRASHIKPWRDSTDLERLDGRNGLTLSPTFDALFDLGYISFSTTGELLVSRQLSSSICDVLDISRGANVLPDEIVSESSEFLSFHRDNVFLAS
jgi:putative restriction endonuclease